MLATYLITAITLLRYLRRMGGVGLVLLGIAGGVLPLPASLEVVTILLAARHRELWWYYGAMAALGSSVGSSVFYILGWTGGTQLLNRRLSANQAKRWMERVSNWGFGSVVVSGLLPPPVPSSPILLVAGAVRYPRRRFAVALVLGRGVRFLLLALIGYLYRREAVNLVNRVLIPIMAAGIIASLTYVAYRWYAGHQKDKDLRTAAPVAAPEAGEALADAVENAGAPVTPLLRRSAEGDVFHQP